MWVSEELNSNDWDDFSKNYSLSIGVALNIVFIVARANSNSSSSSRGDDVFGDYGNTGTGWFAWIVSFLTLLDRS